jgi:GntR family transcriptional regulator, histidine utilization repressor
LNAVAQPLYAQVKNHVLRHIRSGAWRPGERVPSEHELVRELKVSRMTANRALQELTRSGVLSRIAGVGTFVADQKAASHPLQIRSIATEIRERGHGYRAEVLAQERIVASESVRAALGLGTRRSMIFHTLIVHFEKDLPAQLEDRYVNPALAPDYLAMDFTGTTPNEYLMEVAPLQRVEHAVRAMQPDAAMRRHLAMGAKEAVLLIERVTWSRGQRASYALLYHPGNRFELRGNFDI